MIEDQTQILVKSLTKNLIAGTLVVGTLCVGMVGWAATTELSSAVIASGTLVIDGNAKKVQHLSGGTISELLIKEGQLVEAGQVLVELDATVTNANLASVSKEIVQLEARHARLIAERDEAFSVPISAALLERLSLVEADDAMAAERRLFEDRRNSRGGQKARLREQIVQYHEEISGLDLQQQAKADELALIRKEADGARTLFNKGLSPLTRVNSLDRNTARLRGERGQLMASIAQVRAKISETELQLIQIDHEMRAEVAAEVRDVENKYAELHEQETKALNELKHIKIRSPITGVVHQLTVHTIGAVITPAEVLMEIVPNESELTVEVRISPQDVDQLNLGQNVNLRLTAFNRNTTPQLSGILTRVSADLETDQQTGVNYYRAAAAIPKTEIALLKDLVLVPGMPVETFIVTGNRTVASYFLKPITDHAQHVFRED